MGPYDSSLQMFIQAPREVDMRRLAFMRWLAEHGKLEHDIAGPASGPFFRRPEARSSPECPVAV